MRSRAIQKFAKDFLLREDYFPLTLTLSPIGGEGKSGIDLICYGYRNLAKSSTPSPHASGGRGLG